MEPVVHEPATAADAAALLRHASSERTPVVLHGNRTKLAPVAPTIAIALSTRRLTSGLAHYSGDLVATVPAGCTLREINAALALERQWIPLDPPFADSATIGGVVAANDSGPRRHRFGSPRDLIIGIEVAMANGTVAHSGGRVVKNVAGYDLGRLFCGSRGGLGLITSVTFKLAPIAAASRTVVARFADARTACDAALALANGTGHTPSTIELLAPDVRLLVRYETTAASAARMADLAMRALSERSADVRVLAGDDESAVWAEHQQIESSQDGIVSQVSALSSDAGSLLADVERLATERRLALAMTGRAALGVFRVRATGGKAAVGFFAASVREAAHARGGHAEFTHGSAMLPEGFDAIESPGSAAAIGLAVKQRFDPAGVLPFPWGRA